MNPDNTKRTLTTEALKQIAEEIDVQYGPAMKMLAAGDDKTAEDIMEETER